MAQTMIMAETPKPTKFDFDFDPDFDFDIDIDVTPSPLGCALHTLGTEGRARFINMPKSIRRLRRWTQIKTKICENLRNLRINKVLGHKL